MGRCKECKNFQSCTPKLDEWDEKGWGICLLMESDEGMPRYRETNAFGIDAETYHAVVRVALEFGCVMYEPC